jgi:hypothetical protein
VIGGLVVGSDVDFIVVLMVVGAGVIVVVLQVGVAPGVFTYNNIAPAAAMMMMAIIAIAMYLLPRGTGAGAPGGGVAACGIPAGAGCCGMSFFKKICGKIDPVFSFGGAVTAGIVWTCWEMP